MMGWMSPGIGGGSQGGASLIIILGIVIWLVTILVWIEHYMLRGYLWRAGSLPGNAIRFLNSASEYALMRKVGGGYMFTHRLVLEYFARMYEARHRNLS